jgi:hypothetical protein
LLKQPLEAHEVQDVEQPVVVAVAGCLVVLPGALEADEVEDVQVAVAGAVGGAVVDLAAGVLDVIDLDAAARVADLDGDDAAGAFKSEEVVFLGRSEEGVVGERGTVASALKFEQEAPVQRSISKVSGAGPLPTDQPRLIWVSDTGLAFSPVGVEGVSGLAPSES